MCKILNGGDGDGGEGDGGDGDGGDGNGGNGDSGDRDGGDSDGRDDDGRDGDGGGHDDWKKGVDSMHTVWDISFYLYFDITHGNTRIAYPSHVPTCHGSW